VGDRTEEEEFPDLHTHGVDAGVSALQLIFAAAAWGDALDPHFVQTAGETVVQCIETEGLSQWLDVVRRHHSQTYQHCLIVTGVAVSFGVHLGFNSLDKRRLAFAGLLHDIGKARIPVEILEKPQPLTDAETAIMQQHPLDGFEVLKNLPGFQPEMLDMVLHHHEYLDGTGYPHGLQAEAISDLVRVITISDIYGALIERRAYRPPLSGAEAYQTLLEMGPKLDKDLVREFRAVSRVR
jgi:putative nucleotidyltransferase with HDIG domain